MTMPKCECGAICGLFLWGKRYICPPCLIKIITYQRERITKMAEDGFITVEQEVHLLEEPCLASG